MNKIFVILITLLMSISVNCFARTISCDIESDNAVSYHVFSTNNAHNGKVYIKQFVKYVDDSGYEEYWMKVGCSMVTRFMPYLEMSFDDKFFRLKEIQDVRYRHIWAGAFFDATPKSCSYYKIPKDVIEEIKVAKNPIVLVAHRQTVQGIVMKGDIDFNQTIQEIISLEYKDKDKYFVVKDVRK